MTPGILHKISAFLSFLQYFKDESQQSELRWIWRKEGQGVFIQHKRDTNLITPSHWGVPLLYDNISGECNCFSLGQFGERRPLNWELAGSIFWQMPKRTYSIKSFRLYDNPLA